MTVRRGLWLLLALTLVRLAVCAAMPITPDEAYYWTWSRALAPGFLDHPPMVALWIRTGTALLGDSPLGIRALGPLAVAFGSMLLFQAARDLSGDGSRAVGVRAVAMLNATLALGVGCVVMTPDTPLVLFCCLALFGIGRAIATGRGGWWVLTGAAFGAAFDSKYTAVLPAAGLVLWLIGFSDGRRWLRSFWLWLGGALGIGLCLPVVSWNEQHHWASFLRQGGRVGSWQPARAAQFLGELLGGQIGLATPLIFLLMLAGVGVAMRVSRLRGTRALLVMMIVLPSAVFVMHAMGDRVQANWPVLLYPFGVLMAAELTVSPKHAWANRFYCPAVALGFGLTAVVYAQAVWSVLPLSPHHDVMLRQTGGWGRLAADVRAQARPGEAVLADEYGLAAELALNRVPDVIAGPDPRWAYFRMRHDVPQTALLVRSERRRDPLPASVFEAATQVGELVRARAGKQIERYRVYRVMVNPGVTGAALMARIPTAR